jgi:CRP/FNR family transcriptional regulator, cyclic AMP receptor protein
MSDIQAQLFSRFGKKIPANTVLFQEGDVGDNMYIIQAGRVKISKRIRGVEKTLATLEKGEFLGEMAILNDKPRSATAETLDDCDMLVIDRKTFDALIRGNVEIAVRFIKRLADRLREANDQMESLMIKDNTSRLVSVLAKQVREQKKAGEFIVTIEDLAGHAGIEAAQARTILEKLASVRIIEVAGDKVRIMSQDQVDRLVRYLEMREIFGEMV